MLSESGLWVADLPLDAPVLSFGRSTALPKHDKHEGMSVTADGAAEYDATGTRTGYTAGDRRGLATLTLALTPTPTLTLTLTLTSSAWRRPRTQR